MVAKLDRFIINIFMTLFFIKRSSLATIYLDQISNGSEPFDIRTNMSRNRMVQNHFIIGPDISPYFGCYARPFYKEKVHKNIFFIIKQSSLAVQITDVRLSNSRPVITWYSCFQIRFNLIGPFDNLNRSDIGC